MTNATCDKFELGLEACVGCPAVQGIQDAATEYLSEPDILEFIGSGPDGKFKRVLAHAGPLLGFSREEIVDWATTVINSELPDDLLRCAGACVLEPASSTLWNAIDKVRKQREHLNLQLEVAEPTCSEVEHIQDYDPISRFVDEILPTSDTRA